MGTVRYLNARSWVLAVLALCLVVLSGPGVSVSTSEQTPFEHVSMMAPSLATTAGAAVPKTGSLLAPRPERADLGLAVLTAAAVLLSCARSRTRTNAGPLAASAAGAAPGLGRAPPRSS